MKKIFMFLLVCSMTMTVCAQKVNHNFRNVSMSDALLYLSKSTHRYTISFIYDELEDFKVLADVHNQSVPDAIRQLIGFYPISMKVVKGEIDKNGINLPDEIYVECLQKEDHKMIGHIIDEKGNPLDFANVSLLNVKDSSFINGGVSNEAGYFVIPCSAQKVLVKVTYVGYKTVIRGIRVGNIGVIRLYPDARIIRGVTVKGHRKTDHVDHSVYTFSKEQIKNSRQAQELLATLPGLRIDPKSNKISTLSGGTLKILINGIEASDNDLKAITPDKIKNVEYYMVPPARYASVGTLINIHTRKLDNGYAVGFDVQQAPTDGFNNTNAYAKYTIGNHQLSFDYSLNYRNESDCKEKNIYQFSDGKDISTYSYNGDYHFGYANQDFNLKYLYSLDDSLNFQVKFTPNIFSRFWRDRYHITAENNPSWTNATSREDQTANSFGPSLDVYFDKKLKDNQQITLDVLGTYYHNKQGDSNIQNDDAGKELLNDDMRQRNNKYSIIGEVAYTKKWGKTHLSLGYKATLAKSDFKISNVLSDYLEYNYHATNDDHYAYAELGGSFSKLGYRLSIGGTYVHTSNDDTHYNQVYFTPQLMLSYPVKNGIFRLEMVSLPELPSISQLSNNSTITIPGLVSRGNPYLESGNDNTFKLSYSLSNPYIDMMAMGSFEYKTNSISTYYVWQEINGKRTIVSTPMNADYEFKTGGQFTGTLKPFKSELLTFSIETGYWFQKQKSDLIGIHNHDFVPLICSMDFRKGNWGAYCSWRKVIYRLDGPYLQSDENTTYAGVFYRHKQLQVSVSSIFPFTTPRYMIKTLSNNILSYYHINKIPSQRSLIALSVSLNIFSGKQKKINKKINNYDSDKGIF